MKKAATAWVVGGLAVLAIAVGIWAWLRSRKPQPPQYETVKVDQGRIVARVTATGTLSALVTVQVGSQVSGRIAQIFADFNSPVKKGDIIAKIDPELFNAAVEQAKANYAAAKGNLEKAKAQALDAQRQYDRAKALAERDLIATADRDTAESTAAAARAQVSASQGAVEQASAALHQAQVNLQYSTIKSPIDGVVISRSVEEGQTVAASLSAPTLFTIADDLARLQIVANVDEADVGQVAEGQEVSFTVDAFPQSTFKGTVQLIRNSPENVQGVVTYQTIIQVANPEQRLRPGMTANVTIVVAKKKSVLAVSNAALRFRPPKSLVSGNPKAEDTASAEKKRGKRQKSRVTVWRLAKGVPQPEKIRIGITDGAYTEVKEGLDEKDVVVVSAQSAGSPGPSAASPEGKSPVR